MKHNVKHKVKREERPSHNLLIILGVIGALILLTIYPVLYLYSLNSVTAYDVNFYNVKFNEQGMQLEGNFVLQNDGPVAVRIDSITYTITLENTREKIGDGSISGGEIPAKGTAELAFSQQFSWKPSIDTAKALMRDEDGVTVVVAGEAKAKFLGMTFTKPFSFSYDITQFLQQYVQSFVEGLFGKVGDFLGIS